MADRRPGSAFTAEVVLGDDRDAIDRVSDLLEHLARRVIRVLSQTVFELLRRFARLHGAYRERRPLQRVGHSTQQAMVVVVHAATNINEKAVGFAQVDRQQILQQTR